MTAMCILINFTRLNHGVVTTVTGNDICIVYIVESGNVCYIAVL